MVHCLRFSLVSANKPPAMLVEPKSFSFKKKTPNLKMRKVWRPYSNTGGSLLRIISQELYTKRTVKAIACSQVAEPVVQVPVAQCACKRWSVIAPYRGSANHRLKAGGYDLFICFQYPYIPAFLLHSHKQDG